LPPDLWLHLEDRLRRLPADRIRRMADYYALRSVESEHINRLARDLALTETQHDLLEAWWQQRVQREVGAKIEQIGHRHHEAQMRWMISRRRQHPARRLPLRPPGVVRTALFQARFNTIGPGGRTWFGNRYVSIRRRTFRLHWRP
jgi:hypothetical protein